MAEAVSTAWYAAVRVGVMGMQQETVEYKILTRDTFVSALSLERFRATLDDRGVANDLYRFLITHFGAEGILQGLETSVNSGSLPFLVPGTPVHIRLTGLWKESITDLVTCYLLLQHLAKDHPLVITAALVKDLARALSVLRTERGERCIAESLAELHETTAEAICLHLLDCPCRYPGKGCEYMDRTGMCRFGLFAVQQTLDDLEKRQVIAKSVVSTPQQWQIVR